MERKVTVKFLVFDRWTRSGDYIAFESLPLHRIKSAIEYYMTCACKVTGIAMEELDDTFNITEVPFNEMCIAPMKSGIKHANICPFDWLTKIDLKYEKEHPCTLSIPKYYLIATVEKKD